MSKQRRLESKLEKLGTVRQKGEHHRLFFKKQKAKQAISDVLEAADYGKLVRKKGTVLRVATRQTIREIEKGDMPEVMIRAYLEGMTKEIKAQERFCRLSRKVRNRSTAG